MTAAEHAKRAEVYTNRALALLDQMVLGPGAGDRRRAPLDPAAQVYATLAAAEWLAAQTLIAVTA